MTAIENRLLRKDMVNFSSKAGNLARRKLLLNYRTTPQLSINHRAFDAAGMPNVTTDYRISLVYSSNNHINLPQITVAHRAEEINWRSFGSDPFSMPIALSAQRGSPSFSRDAQDIPESRRQPILAGMSAEERVSAPRRALLCESRLNDLTEKAGQDDAAPKSDRLRVKTFVDAAVVLFLTAGIPDD